MERILESIAIAKSRGATLRVGPELEIPWVNLSQCEEKALKPHNLEATGAWTISSRVRRVAVSNRRNLLSVVLGDTALHSWEVLIKILQSEEAQGIVCDVGMCV
jgi:NAD+ synthase (glutamine-hydrolysing)